MLSRKLGVESVKKYHLTNQLLFCSSKMKCNSEKIAHNFESCFGKGLHNSVKLGLLAYGHGYSNFKTRGPAVSQSILLKPDP